MNVFRAATLVSSFSSKFTKFITKITKDFPDDPAILIYPLDKAAESIFAYVRMILFILRQGWEFLHYVADKPAGMPERSSLDEQDDRLLQSVPGST
jgi:hypothetical protein